MKKLILKFLRPYVLQIIKESAPTKVQVATTENVKYVSTTTKNVPPPDQTGVTGL